MAPIQEFISNVGNEVAHTLTSDNSASDSSKACTDSTSLRRREVSPALVEVLTYSKPVQKKKQENWLSLPKHLSSNQMIEYLQEKRQKKQDEEDAKKKRKAECLAT